MRCVLAFVVLFALFGTMDSMTAAEEPEKPRMTSVDFETTIDVAVRMNYWLYLPPNYEQQDQWPLLIFLHGAGERGSDLEKVKVHGPPKLISEGRDFPFVVVAPQCESTVWWNGDAIAAFTRDAAERYKIDPKRIYLTGLSMGGYGTWDAVAKHPELYAAIAPICGGGEPKNAERHKQVPTWVFHGAEDRVVPLERSQAMVSALEAVGAPVKFTVYPTAGHDSWTETYNNPELYEWLLSHTR